MARQILVRLDDEILDKLDELAKASGRVRLDLIRTYIAYGIAEDAKRFGETFGVSFPRAEG